MKSVCYRQGDVFLIPMKKAPAHNGRTSHSGVLAEGEATGHAHRLDKATEADVFTLDNQMYLDVLEEKATIIHEEHGPITLPRGVYMVRIQREYSPKGIRRVYD
jgi:hypothetical protein